MAPHRMSVRELLRDTLDERLVAESFVPDGD
jgi:hypothetical protein